MVDSMEYTESCDRCGATKSYWGRCNTCGYEAVDFEISGEQVLSLDGPTLMELITADIAPIELV